MKQNLWAKLYRELQDNSRWKLYGWNACTYRKVEGSRFVDLAWYPSTMCYNFLREMAFIGAKTTNDDPNTYYAGSDKEYTGSTFRFGHKHFTKILKVQLDGYGIASKAKYKYYYDPETEDQPTGFKKRKNKNVSSPWDQACIFDDEHKVIHLRFSIINTLCSYRRYTADHPNMLVPQKIKITLSVPFISGLTEGFPVIKNASKEWRRRHQFETSFGHCAPGGGGAIKFVTYITCRIASANNITGFKDAVYDINPPAYLGWQVRDYRISHNRKKL